MELLAGRSMPSFVQFILKSNRYSDACNDWWNWSPNLHSRRGEATREAGGLVPFTLASRWTKGWHLTSVSLHDMLGFPWCLKLLIKVRRRKGYMSLLLFIIFSIDSRIESTLLVVVMTERELRVTAYVSRTA